MLISYFGLCKRLEVDQTGFVPTTYGAITAGSRGWRAPEILRGEMKLDKSNASQSSRGSAKPAKLTEKVDIFALGCLFYYCLTKGRHLYGGQINREARILHDQKSMGDSYSSGKDNEATDLIKKMLNKQASLWCVRQPSLFSG